MIACGFSVYRDHGQWRHRSCFGVAMFGEQSQQVDAHRAGDHGRAVNPIRKQGRGHISALSE
jgi:hypothetical protein